MSGVIWMVVRDQVVDVWLADAKALLPIAMDRPISIDESDELSDSLNFAGAKGWPVVVSPSACDCFFTIMDDGANTSEKNDGKSASLDIAALTYELESHLPMDAEFTAADFRSLGGGTLAAVAVDSRRVGRCLDLLNSMGRAPVAIVPKTMLVVRGWLESTSERDRWTGRLWIVGPQQSEAVEISNGAVVGWKWLPASNDPGIERYQCLHPSEHPQHVVMDDTAATDSNGDEKSIRVSLPAALASLPQTAVSSILVPPIQSHAQGKDASWWNLQTGPLAPEDPLWAIRRPLRTIAVALVGLIAAIWLAGWYRGNRIETEIANLSDQQRTAFAETFPGRRVPAATLRSVRSEYTRSMGSRALASSPFGDGLDLPISSADILRRLLASLPPEIRFRINRIDISNDDLTIDLQVTRPIDAGTIATSLTEMGFDVNPPVTTQKDNQTYDSTIDATYVGAVKLVADRSRETPSNPSRGGNP